tara:strand:- start:69 stop:530 length:462 start_codon:yes stop_codon:yes gene_type:complete
MSEDTSTLNPSIVVLKTGEKLITILQEVFEGEGDDRKGVCLLMNYPYELSLITVPNEEDPEKDLQVKYSKWCPYSLESSFRIPYDGILTIGSPDPGLTSAYMAKVDVVKGADTPDPQPASGSNDSPNWQAQQQLVAEAIRGGGTPPAINPEVV